MNIITEEGPVELNLSFFEEVERRSGQPINACYHCQKCSSGCPMAEFMDYAPNQILRMAQFGLKDRALRTSAIWVCSGCETCGVRCPNDIKISEVMDTFSEIALEEGIPAKEKNIPIFHDVFLNSVRSNGRIHETFMMIGYKLKSGDLFSDIDVGIKMILKGKLPLLPGGGVKNKGAIKDLFNKVNELKKA